MSSEQNRLKSEPKAMPIDTIVMSDAITKIIGAKSLRSLKIDLGL